MPFTVSHAAFAVPFQRISSRYVCFSALMIGSMAPDFEYLLRMSTSSEYGHHFDAIFWFTLPLSFFLLFLFHHWVRDPLINHLPDYLYNKFSSHLNFKFHKYVVKYPFTVIGSLLLGIISHLLLDAVSHPHGYASTHWQGWSTSVVEFNPFIFSFNRFFGHFFSLLGLLSLVYWIVKLPSSPSQPRIYKFKPYWWVVFLLITTVVTIGSIIGVDQRTHAHILIWILTGSALGVVIASRACRKHFKEIKVSS